MLDIQFIRQQPGVVRAAIKNKGFDLDLDELLAVDKERRDALAVLEQRRARKNELSALIPKASKEERSALVEEGKRVRTEIEQLERALKQIGDRFQDLMLRVPSVPRPDVPIGKGEEDNVELRRVGDLPVFDFTPKDHVELMTLLGLVDWDGPRRFAGGRSYALTGDGALLELSILRLAVDTLVERGFQIVCPPVMVKERAMVGTGFFPLSRDEAYAIPADELFLVGTSEVPLVSMHCDETFDATMLPLKCAGISPCFRREAGAYGKDTRGLYRVHQFTKVEQVVFCAPDEGVAERHHYELLANAEAVLAKLEIPYRVAIACTGEIGIGQTRKHEIESWMPGRSAFCETHSCSTLGDFQARRSNIRVRTNDGSLAHPFTLNNTAVASPRILIPLLENHQTKDGSVRLPRALVSYMNGKEILVPRV
ncbi:MAG: serine--tRNA ligase [Polyangiaceae bacterium]|jgi:seryl-tRNA synthetase